MAQKEETKFAVKVDRDIKNTFGLDAFYENIQQVGKRGTPDRLLCIRGRFIALELKTEVGTPTRIQMLKLQRIKNAGGLAYLVTPSTWPRILKELEEMCTWNWYNP